MTSFCTTDYPSRIAAELAEVPCPSGWESSQFHGLPRLDQTAIWCVQAALEDAGLWKQPCVPGALVWYWESGRSG